MENKLSEYFGGTGITLEKLKQVMPTINVDGTTYKLEDWFKECDIFKKLTPGKSKVWVPYGGAEYYDTLKEVVWCKYNFKHYFEQDEYKDWWIYIPYLIVGDYYVYEVSFYKKYVKRKSQIRELNRRKLEPKRKFLSYKDIEILKRDEIINNRKRKNK
jgi:hypothetical protein